MEHHDSGMLGTRNADVIKNTDRRRRRNRLHVEVGGEDFKNGAGDLVDFNWNSN